MIRTENCERAIRAGLDFLKRTQLPSGEFVTFVARDEKLLIDARHDPSVFATAHVVLSLVACGISETRTLVKSAVQFFLQQQLPGICWKFWPHAHPGFGNIPPDVDDTSVVSAALRDSGYGSVKNHWILLANRNAAGLFYTWIRPSFRHALNLYSWMCPLLWFSPNIGRKDFFHSGEAKRDDIDVVVNTNAVCWLSSFPNKTKLAREWILRVLSDGSAATRDRYYQNEEALLYASSRCYRSSVQGFSGLPILIAEKAFEKIDSYGSVAGSVQRTALLGSSLAATHGPSDLLDRVVLFLISNQRPDGSWPSEAFYYGGWSKDYSWGSEALTAAFCLEAICLYLRMPRR